MLNRIQFILDIIALLGICFCIGISCVGYSLAPLSQLILLVALGLFILKQTVHDYREM